jgi:hypothetical protein
MANDKDDPKSGKPDQPERATESAEKSAESKRSGRVSFDSRGNSVWEWQLETGVYSRDVSTQKLKKLDLGDLSIAETAIHERPKGLELEDAPAPGGGFNPYNNAPRTKQAGFNPYDNARALSNKVAPKRASTATSKSAPKSERAPPRSLEELRKLSAWIKLKRNLGKKSGD